MSGPKISVYALTGRARTIVFGQIRCEQQSLVCFAKIQEIVQSISSVSSNFDQQIRNIQLLMKRTSEGAEQMERLQTLQEEIKAEEAEIKRQLAAHTPRRSPKYRVSEDAYAKKQAELKRLQTLKKRAEALRAKLDAAFDPDGRKPLKSEPGFLCWDNADSIRKIQKSIADELSGVSSFEFDEETPDTSFQDKKDALRKELSALLSDSLLPDAIARKIKQAVSALQKIESIEYLTTFHSITVTSIFKEIDAFRREEKERKAAYAELTSRYETLCSMAGEDAKRIPYSESAVEILHSEAERLELFLVRQQEQVYIRDCVDEVMSDMGYDLIGSREVLKKSGKRFRNELFTLNEGTAVNVTFSSDGQIMMELGGLAREDRIPTSDETEALIRDMENFCGEFAEFERRMLAMGIVVRRRIVLSPPAAEYAAIINVNDYDIAESTQVSVMNAAEKHRKQTQKRTMRRGE